jgi:hypothetical protein
MSYIVMARHVTSTLWCPHTPISRGSFSLAERAPCAGLPNPAPGPTEGLQNQGDLRLAVAARSRDLRPARVLVDVREEETFGRHGGTARRPCHNGRKAECPLFSVVPLSPPVSRPQHLAPLKKAATSRRTPDSEVSIVMRLCAHQICRYCKSKLLTNEAHCVYLNQTQVHTEGN